MESPDKLGVGAPIIMGPLTEEQNNQSEAYGIAPEAGLAVHYRMAGYIAASNSGLEDPSTIDHTAKLGATVTHIDTARTSPRADGHIRKSIRRGTRRKERDLIDEVSQLAAEGRYEDILDLDYA